MTVPSCPDDRTITSFISIGVKSDRTVTSTYVFGAKMGLLTVFCLPFQKRPMNPFHFCCRVNSCHYTHFKKKKSIPTRLEIGWNTNILRKWHFCHFCYIWHTKFHTKLSKVTVLSPWILNCQRNTFQQNWFFWHVEKRWSSDKIIEWLCITANFFGLHVMFSCEQ